jgi:MFS family permease
MGAYHMIFSVAFGLGPWLGTILLDHCGGSIVWITMFCTGALSTILLRYVATPAPKTGSLDFSPAARD